jgi:hypothetical protein
MKGSFWLLWAMAVALAAQPTAAWAQRHQGHGTGLPRGDSGISDKDDLKDFKRAVELQASPDQVESLRQLRESVAEARKQAQNILLIANAPSSTFEHDLNQHADPLSDAVDETEKENERLLKSFSSAQKSGLKATRKKLEKASSEIAKESQALAQLLDHSGVQPSQIIGPAERLSKALSEFEVEERSLGNEMGVQESGPDRESADSARKPTN